MSAPALPGSNHLLQALDSRERLCLQQAMEPVQLSIGEVLCEAEQPQRYATFPTSGLVALNYVTSDGATSAVALVGCEGFVGICLFLSGARSLIRAQVVVPGTALRLGAEALARVQRPGGRMQVLALHYVQALTIQMAQTAVCNRHHGLHQQLSRWLLLALDRSEDKDLHLTQEQLAHLLGVRREGVTEAAGRLQDAGLIRYSRGLIHLLDRKKLEADACECYGVVRREYDRLLSLPPEYVR